MRPYVVLGTKHWSPALSYATNARSMSWPRLLLGALFTAILALSVHVIMLQVLHVPYPAGFPRTGPGAWLNAVPSILGAILLYSFASSTLTRYSFVTRSVVLFLLITMLQEIFFRAPIMDGVVTTAWTFSFVSNIPRLFDWLLLSCLIVAVTPYARNIWLKMIAATILYALVFIACKPLIERAFAPVLSKLSFLAHDEVYGLPYGMHVLLPAYLTYAEPVIAALLTAALLWDHLSARSALRILQFTFIVLLIRHHLFALIIYPFYAEVPVTTALLSMGQFTLETIVLATMTALTWHYARRTQR
jgi:hypothetical protein